MYIRVCLFIVLIVFISAPVFAQLEIGASYELRDEDPQSGFGVRVEKGFLKQVPLVNIGMRAHFSFFSENNDISEDGISYSENLTNYDFGVALTAGVSVGLIEPYIGLGLGSTTLEVKKKDFVSIPQGFEQEPDANESNIYFNGIIGSKVTIIPILKPFVEYRYSNASLSEPEVAELTTGRIVFGVSLSF
tara:strand:- start:5858 stop:6427 length:570 start_codon:yes stop_codon:yes gene_type:complete